MKLSGSACGSSSAGRCSRTEIPYRDSQRAGRTDCRLRTQASWCDHFDLLPGHPGGASHGHDPNVLHAGQWHRRLEFQNLSVNGATCELVDLTKPFVGTARPDLMDRIAIRVLGDSEPDGLDRGRLPQVDLDPLRSERVGTPPCSGAVHCVRGRQLRQRLGRRDVLPQGDVVLQ